MAILRVRVGAATFSRWVVADSFPLLLSDRPRVSPSSPRPAEPPIPDAEVARCDSSGFVCLQGGLAGTSRQLLPIFRFLDSTWWPCPRRLRRQTTTFSFSVVVLLLHAPREHSERGIPPA